MLRCFQSASEVPSSAPAREVHGRPPPGQGWPHPFPPLRAAPAFGWNVPTAFGLRFLRGPDGTWRIDDPVDRESDGAWRADAFLARAQAWLARDGKGEPGERRDLRGQCTRQQQHSRFVGLP